MRRPSVRVLVLAAVGVVVLFVVGAGLGRIFSSGGSAPRSSGPVTPPGTSVSPSPTSLASPASTASPTSLATSPSIQAVPTTQPGVAPVTASCDTSGRTNPVFSHVAGNRLIDTAGTAFSPNGITVYGLAYPKTWATTVGADEAQITEAARSWCTNYIRLQLSPRALLSKSPYDPTYLQAIDTEVQTALRLGNDVMLTVQTEHGGNKPVTPDPSIVQFWKVLAPRYAGNPRIWYDLFNEPRAETGKPDMWSIWRDGGNGYVGMQELATDVRAMASNLIVIEGPSGAEVLKEVPAHPITVANVAYGVHPYHQNNLSTWRSDFGDAAATVPVLVTEWSEYARQAHECTTAASTMVPAFLSYLRSEHIGLGAWALVPGVLVTSSSTFAPTSITSTYTCNAPETEQAAVKAAIASDGRLPAPQPQGAGSLIQAFFRTGTTATG